MIFKSLYPKSNVYIVDMDNERLLDEFLPLNNQILFSDFDNNSMKFDAIFMNDVFEHVTFPLETLKILRSKLKNNGFIFIDTPCQFWLYPVTKLLSKDIHRKLLKGTVDHDHQQIYSKKSFSHVVNHCGFHIQKYLCISEYTQPPKFYLDNMNINSKFLRFMGNIFYRMSPFVAKNKIMAVIK